jgi:hypothetical protein
MILNLRALKKQRADDDASRGTELLISALLLETYNAEDDSADSLESCLDATEKLFNLSKKSKTAEEDEHSAIDLLIDVIIGILEKSSAFGKSVAVQAFGLLSGSVENSTIDLILLVGYKVDFGAIVDFQCSNSNKETSMKRRRKRRKTTRRPKRLRRWQRPRRMKMKTKMETTKMKMRIMIATVTRKVTASMRMLK